MKRIILMLGLLTLLLLSGCSDEESTINWYVGEPEDILYEICEDDVCENYTYEELNQKQWEKS